MSYRSGRKKRDEPFNPFAPNASAKRNKRQTERARVNRRAVPSHHAPNQAQDDTGISNLADKQKEAMERMEKSKTAMRVTEFCQKHPEVPEAREIIGSIKPLLDKLLIPPIGTGFKARWDDVYHAITEKTSEESSTKLPRISKEDRLTELRRKSELSRSRGKQKKTQTAVETHTKPKRGLLSNNSHTAAPKARRDVFKPVPTVQSNAHQRGESKPNQNRGRNRNTQKNKNETRYKPEGNKNSPKRKRSKKNAKVVQRANITVPRIQNYNSSMKTEDRQQIIDRLRQEHSHSKNFKQLEKLNTQIRKLVAKDNPKHAVELENHKKEFYALLKHFPAI
jgi:hypothetical protein